ncbi:phage distal tail protein [Streptosporangium saharense]|uniref:phage distal tail protein n=1 Tax=Streptosporangium saharense TaxID=1706840 RepID=UPI0034289961
MAGELIAAPWQMQWGGLLIGTGTPYSIQKLHGWLDLPGLDMGTTAKPTRPGSWGARPRPQSRVVTLELEVRAGVDRMDEVVSALRAATPRSLTADEAPLAVRLRGETLMAFGKVSNRLIVVDHSFSQALTPAATLQWLCSDPRCYELAERSVTITPGVSGSGGLVYPLAYPLTYGTAGASNNATATNIGNDPSSPLLTFTGPITTPRLVNTTLGYGLEFAVDVLAGQTLVVDTDAGTVLLNGSDRLYTRSNLSVPVEYFELYPGDNNLTLLAAAFGTGASLTVTWKSAYL